MMKVLRLSVFTLALAIAALSSAQDATQKITAALKRADDSVAAIVAVPNSQRTYENTILALDDLDARLDAEINLPLFLANVSTDANERDAMREAEELVANWYIEFNKREDLYAAVKSYADTKPSLEGERKRLLDFILRDYRRAGMMLPTDKREKLKEIEREINKLEIEFSKNIADDETRLPFTAAELKGVPADVLGRLQNAAGIYLVSFDGPTYGAVMDNCTVATTRQKCWTAYRRRGGTKNVRVLERIISLRDQMATLLGYKNFVDYVLEPRMAKDSATVRKFYDDLAPLIAKKAVLDAEEFRKAKRELAKDTNSVLMPWDYAITKNYLLKKKYAVDHEKVKEYFPMERVVEGLFSITSSLFGIEYKDVTASASALGLPIWHPDAKLYEVVDKKTGEMLGRMYTDLYPREGKYTHAACWGLVPRKIWSDGTVQKPLAALVCNFNKPTADKPSLLTHDQVETFFHEFGHGLHNILTNNALARFHGTRVARDFVEAPSQMLENWVWAPEVLKTFAKHYKTNEILPQKMLDGMKRARTLGSGIETQGQFFLGEMDQAYHTAPGGKVDTTKVGYAIYEKTTIYKAVPGTFFQAAFTHLIGYAGAYYGYQWSLVYAQDMFQRFDELGLLSPETGAYYREKVLARGGTMDEMAMLRDYLGREPSMDAFYKLLGLDIKK